MCKLEIKNSQGFDLSSILVGWYLINKRDLPWRDTTDPYYIWLSEVILQQTRVDQGRAYFDRFVNRFPTVADLAEAEEDEVLKLWQGLGYYSRTRNLHTAAKTIVEQYKGVFPTEYKDVLSLKGVGEYTAAAIVSFAYNQPYAVVDGNVYRVLSRIFGIDDPIDSTKGKKVFAQLAQEMINPEQAALHNQAIMEFGALQCVPTSPDCAVCPASAICLAYASGRVGELPVKQGKTKVRDRYFYYFDIRLGNQTFISKRVRQDIWKNLYELPMVELDGELPTDELIQTSAFSELFANAHVCKIGFVKRMKHVLSHQIIHAFFYRIDVSQPINGDYLLIATDDIESFPVSRLIHKYLEDY